MLALAVAAGLPLASCRGKSQPQSAPADAATNRPGEPVARIANPAPDPMRNPPVAAITNAPATAPFHREWTMDDLLPPVRELAKGRDFQQGKWVFEKSLCGACHAFAAFSPGTGLAPDLSSVGNQYPREFLLQSIVEPSAVINGQYYFTNFHLKDGEVVSGKLIEMVDGKYRVAPSVAAPDTIVELKEEEVAALEPSPVSPMPTGMLNTFTQDQILDLIAFLMSGGNPQAGFFSK